jgi:hypothetical protein
MTRSNLLGIVVHTVDQDTYDQFDQERYHWFHRTIDTRTKLERDILPKLSEPARQAVRDYILAEQELRSAEFRFACVKVDGAETALDAEPIE